MGESVERLVLKVTRLRDGDALLKLTRVVVAPYVRIRNGKRENVEGYSYEEQGGKLVPGTRRPLSPQELQKVGTRQVPQTQQQVESGRTNGKGKGEVGSQSNPIVTDNVDVAAKALSEGKWVQLKRPREVSTLVQKLKQLVDDAKAKGEDAPNINLCQVSVKGTNLFCAENLGKTRFDMPQLAGIPNEGSPAADEKKFPRNEKGEVDLSEAFAQHLEEIGMTVESGKMDAKYLKATQKELGGAQVAKLASIMEKNGIDPKRAELYITADDYILDGHHRWAAIVAVELAGDKPVEIPVKRINVDIVTALDEAIRWTQDMGIRAKALGAAEPEKTVRSPGGKPLRIPAYERPEKKVAKLSRKVRGCDGCP